MFGPHDERARGPMSIADSAAQQAIQNGTSVRWNRLVRAARRSVGRRSTEVSEDQLLFTMRSPSEQSEDTPP